MAGKNKEYADKYAEYAMEQMRRYGIPASVTLAQGILESSNGQSELARKENNHFGIKATQSWIAEGGRYSLYSDDTRKVSSWVKLVVPMPAHRLRLSHTR